MGWKSEDEKQEAVACAFFLEYLAATRGQMALMEASRRLSHLAVELDDKAVAERVSRVAEDAREACKETFVEATLGWRAFLAAAGEEPGDPSPELEKYLQGRRWSDESPVELEEKRRDLFESAAMIHELERWFDDERG